MALNFNRQINVLCFIFKAEVTKAVVDDMKIQIMDERYEVEWINGQGLQWRLAK